MKKLLIVLGIVVLLLVIGVGILVANLDRVVNSRKDYILDRAETALGRDVAIDDIGVSLGLGVGVKLSGVTVGDDPGFSSEPFVAAKDLTAKVKLLPLIKKQVEVKRLVLNEPVINVIRNEDGAFNFASISQAETGAGGASPPAQPAETAAAATVALAYADIENGTLHYSDRQGGVELEVDRIDFAAKNAALGQEASVDFKASILADEQNVSIEGTVGPVQKAEAPEDLAPTPLELTATLQGVSADQIRRVFPGQSELLAKLDAIGLGSAGASIGVKGTLGALELSRLEVAAAVLGADEPNVTFRAQAEPFDALQLARGGEAAPVRFTGRLEGKRLALDRLAKGLATLPEPLRLSGEAAATVEIGGSPEALSVEAEVDLTSGEIRYGEQFHKPSGLEAGVTSRLSLAPTAATLERCVVKAGEMELQASGTIAYSGEVPDVDLEVRSTSTDIAGVVGMMPALTPFSLGGTLDLAARVRGGLGQKALPDVKGSLELKGGRAKLEQIPQPVTGAAAKVQFTEASARVENAEATVGRSAVQVTASATSLQPLEATYRVWSDQVHRQDFNAPPKSAKAAPQPEVLRNVEVKGRLWQDGETVRYDAAATSSGGTLASLNYSDLAASIGSTEGRLEIREFSAKTMGGTVGGSGAFAAAADPPRFEVTTRVRSVNLTEYFAHKVKSLPRFIEGSIDLDLDVAGAGKEWENIKSTLSGTGGVVVVRGALLNVNIANDLLYGIEQLPLIDGTALERVRQRNPKLFSGNNTTFKDLRGNIRIENGRIHSQGLVLDTPDYKVFGEGWVSFDYHMDLKTNIVFSQSATQNLIRDLKELKYLANERGQLELPVALTGPVTRPNLVPDIDALTRKIQEAAIDAGVDKLRDELGDEVSDFLKGFGKKSGAKKDTTKSR